MPRLGRGRFFVRFRQWCARRYDEIEACSLGLLDSPLCRPNDLKAVSREMQCPSHEIGFAKYEEAFKEATYLVQKDDKHVRECIFRAAEVDGDKERNATTQIRKRLAGLTPRRALPSLRSWKESSIAIPAV